MHYFKRIVVTRCFRCWTLSLLLIAQWSPALAAGSGQSGSFSAYESRGLRFGEIHIRRDKIFDTSIPAEDRRLYRAANRLHVVTHESVVRAQLMIRPGDRVTQQAVEESERLLRRNSYIYDVRIEPVSVHDGVVDVQVITRDNWTLFPELGYSRQGGQTEYALGMRESNLLGTGATLGVRIEDDGDRESSLLRYRNRNILGTWWQFEAGYRDSDDGDGQRLRLLRPFFSLDSRYSAGIEVNSVEQEEPLFSFGDEVAEYRRDLMSLNLFYGWSAGLRDGWSRRWQTGFAIDDNRFDVVNDPGQLLVRPADRNLRYPYIRYEAIEDRFTTVTNLDRIAVTEDLFLGTQYSALLGWFGSSTGSDRDGAIFALDYLTTKGDPSRWLWRSRITSRGRVEGGTLQDGRLTLSSEWVRRQSSKRQWAVALTSTIARRPDLDRPVVLGGLTGLRGFERAFGNGDASALVTVEQRWITEWYPFRLFRVGAAAFIDAGRIFGEDIRGLSNDSTLANIGFGLRLMSTRASSNRMLHIDFAYPVTDGSGIDRSLQVSIQGKRGF